MTILEKIIQQKKRFYPDGRAFSMPIGSFRERLIKALALSEERAYQDALSIRNNILPDNPDFTEDDATAWEHRLGLITNPLVPLSTRKQAIARKMNHPGTVKAREARSFIEKTLRDAGFDVYVHENIFDDGMGGTETKSPEEVTGMMPPQIQYGDAQYGDFQYGTGIWELAVNYIDRSIDNFFNIGTNLRFTFFIGGPYVGDFADVDKNRLEEFRQLILKSKPANTVAYLFINYV